MNSTYCKKLLSRFSFARLLFLAIPVAVILFYIYPPGRARIQISLSSNIETVFQIYWAGGNQNYIEKRSVSIEIKKGGPHRYTLFLPDLDAIHKLRIDPAKKSCEVTISSLIIQQIGYKAVRFAQNDELSQLHPRYDIAEVDFQPNGMKIISKGIDPQLETFITPVVTSKIESSINSIIGYLKLTILSLVASLGILYCFKIISKSYYILYKLNRLHYNEISDNKKNGNRLLNNNIFQMIVTLILFCIILLLLGQKINFEFNSSNIFGTNSSPSSDAFVWLRGALYNYFNKETIYPLYRPTVGMFFSSIYSVFDRIYFIPFFSIIFFYINISLLFVLFDQRVKVYLTLFLLLSLIFFNELVEPLNLGQIMIDFLPFVFTSLGVFFSGWALINKKINYYILYSGILFLGMASALRGVQLIGGFIIAIMAMILMWKRSKLFYVIITPIIFIIPLVFDTYLQKITGAENNGIISFFCFYSDHHHFYTRACKHLYRTMELSHIDVLGNYLKFLFTKEGFGIFFGYVEDLINAGLTIIQSKYYLTLLILSATILLLKDYSPAL